MDMNNKAKNIKEYEKIKRRITKSMTMIMGEVCEAVGVAYGVYIESKTEINIIPIGEKK